jgi:hypothetical protein
MNHFDFWLHDFNRNRAGWQRTYFALLPLELLQKIITLKRKDELKSVKTVLHHHWLCRRRGIGRNIYNHEVLFYPYFSSNKKKIVHEVKIDAHKLSIRVKFSKLRKEYSMLFSDKQFALQRPHFTICSETYFTTKAEYHYQISDWRFYQGYTTNLGKML